MIDGETIKPGAYYDMPSEKYAKAEGLSAGSIKRLLKNPLYYIDRYRRPHLYPSSREQIIGRALHCYLLEPDQFEARFPVLPNVNRASNNGLDTLIEWYGGYKKLATGKVPAEIADLDTTKQPGKRKFLQYLENQAGAFDYITEKEFETLLYMRESWDLPEHETVRNVFTGGDGANEVSLFWRDSESGVVLKARPDRLTEYDGGAMVVIGDLKSTTDASYTGVAKAIPNFGYDVQAALCIDGVQNLFPRAEVIRFIFGAIEKNPPYGAAPYVFNDPQDIAVGGRKCRVGITLYKQCLDTESWPSYPNHIQPMSMPTWAKR